MQWWCSAQGVAWSWMWRPYPGVWAFVFLLAAAHALLLYRTGGHTASGEVRARLVSSAAGFLTLWIALDWPVGALGAGYLASVHMVQFLLSALVVPPLLLMGVPPTVRSRLHGVAKRMRVVRMLTHPLVALTFFNVVVIATHVPAVLDPLMRSQLGSFVIDLTWLGAGLIFWAPVVMPDPEASWRHEPIRIAYLASQVIAGTPLFVYLTFSQYPLYATYELAPRVHGIDARADQQVAGLLMQTGATPIFLTAVSLLFFRWMHGEGGEGAEPGHRVRRFGGDRGEAAKPSGRVQRVRAG